MAQTLIFYPTTVLQRFLFGNEECMVFSCSDLPLRLVSIWSQTTADRRSQKVLRSSAIIWKHTSAIACDPAIVIADDRRRSQKIEPCSIFCPIVCFDFPASTTRKYIWHFRWTKCMATVGSAIVCDYMETGLFAIVCDRLRSYGNQPLPPLPRSYQITSHMSANRHQFHHICYLILITTIGAIK